jgi:alpha-tubulin suppressor-like RCC1 family protein
MQTLNIPTEITVLQEEDVTQIAAAGPVSAALTSNGQVFTWGRTKKCVFGGDQNEALPPPTANLTLPTPLEAEGIVFTKIACGKTHFVGITNNGKLISWGSPDQGKLGHRKKASAGDTKKPAPESTRKRIQYKNTYADKDEIDFVIGDLESKKVVDAACGFSHTAAVTEDGLLYTWGQGTNGALGHGDFENAEIPRKVEGLSNIVKVKCGIDYTIAMDKDGNLYSWGLNKYGQLGYQVAGT